MKNIFTKENVNESIGLMLLTIGITILAHETIRLKKKLDAKFHKN